MTSNVEVNRTSVPSIKTSAQEVKTSIGSIKNAQLSGSKKSSSATNQEQPKKERTSSVGAPFDTKRVSISKTDSPVDHEKLYEQYILRNNPLFATVVGSPAGATAVNSADSSILITGFGLRNLKSLEDALQKDEEKKMRELYMMKSSPLQIQTPVRSHGSFSEYYGSEMGQSEAMSQTELSSTSTASRTSQKSFGQQKRLEYLLGITTEGEGEEQEEAVKNKLDEIVYEEQGTEEELTGTTEAMKQAQKYLKSHKIFEFFQFLIANMLSNLPGIYGGYF